MFSVHREFSYIKLIAREVDQTTKKRSDGITGVTAGNKSLLDILLIFHINSPTQLSHDRQL